MLETRQFIHSFTSSFTHSPSTHFTHSLLPSFIHFGSVHFIPFVQSPTRSSVRSCIIHSIFSWFTHCSLMHLIRRIFESNETMDRGTFATGRVVQHTTWYSTAETNVRHGHSTVGPWFVTKNCNLYSVLCKMYPVHCQQNQGLLAKTALYFISIFFGGGSVGNTQPLSVDRKNDDDDDDDDNSFWISENRVLLPSHRGWTHTNIS